MPGGIGLGYLRRVVSEASRMSGADAITHPLTGVTLQFSCHAVQLFNAEHVNSRHEEKVSYWYTHVSMFKLTVEFHWHLPHASIAEYTTLLQVHSSIPLTRRYQVFGSVSGPMLASPVGRRSLSENMIVTVPYHRLTCIGTCTWYVQVGCDETWVLSLGIDHLCQRTSQ